jgi:hypothetical protein
MTKEFDFNNVVMLRRELARVSKPAIPPKGHCVAFRKGPGQRMGEG